MRNAFGPWGTAIHAGRNPQLDRFWKRRLTMLRSISRRDLGLTPRSLRWLVAVAVMATAVPTLRVGSAAAPRQEDDSRKTQATAATGVEGEKAASETKLSLSAAKLAHTVEKGRLRYAERSFDEWKDVLVTDLDPDTRVKAIRALEAFGTKGYHGEAVPALAEVLRRESNDNAALAAGAALAQIGGEGVAALAKALKHENVSTRLHAAGAFGYYSQRTGPALAAVPALVEATKDEEPSIRQRACRALGFILDDKQPTEATRAAVPALMEALRDKRPAVRSAAAAALGKIGPDAAAAVPLLMELTRIGTLSFARSRRPGPDQENDPTRVPKCAISALGDIGPAAQPAVPLLTELSQATQGPRSRYRDFARGALKKIQKGTQR